MCRSLVHATMMKTSPAIRSSLPFGSGNCGRGQVSRQQTVRANANCGAFKPVDADHSREYRESAKSPQGCFSNLIYEAPSINLKVQFLKITCILNGRPCASGGSISKCSITFDYWTGSGFADQVEKSKALDQSIPVRARNLQSRNSSLLEIER